MLVVKQNLQLYEGADKMIIEVNKEDWTGERIKVKVNQTKRTFKLFGDNFKLEKKTKGHYHITGDQWDYSLGKVFVNEDGTASGSGNGCIEREGNNIFEAAIKVLSNIL